MSDKNTMLIVDDLEINRDILKEMFQNDFCILLAENGQKCIELVQKYGKQINVLLLDIQMPVMSGYDVLKYRSKDPLFQEIPVIIITVNDEVQDQVEVFQLGATDYITKPFIREIVIHRINNVLSSKRRVEEIMREKESLQVRSELDLMTGLYNKVTAERLISSKLAHNKKRNALMVIDIDNFKQVNDYLGHLVGDHTIRIIADLISGHFRKTDVVGRIGGDEFVVFMEGLPSDDMARKKADSLAKMLRYKPNVTMPANVSVSIGLMITQPRPYLFDEVYKGADEALYRAKRNGRGRYEEYGRQDEERYSPKNEMAALIFSRNKEICGIVNIMNEDIDVIERLSPEDLSHNSELHFEHVCLIYLDISMEPDNGLSLIEQMQSIEWMKPIPFIAICREGDMGQYAAAIYSGAEDLIMAPIDITFARRRTMKFFSRCYPDKIK